MTMPQLCIVFDLDDTLYLERDFVRSGFDAVGRWAYSTLGISDCAERAWRAFESGVRGSIFQFILAESGQSPDATLIQEMVEVYRRHSPVISLPSDSLNCLQRLKNQAVLAIITDGFLHTQQAKCSSLSLSDFFNTIVCTGQWGPEYYKPNPHAFSYVAQQAGPSSRFVYIADNPTKDFQAPLALGWDVVRIRRPGGIYSSREWHTHPAPYVELPDLWDVPDLLMEQFQLEPGPSIHEARP